MVVVQIVKLLRDSWIAEVAARVGRCLESRSRCSSRATTTCEGYVGFSVYSWMYGVTLLGGGKLGFE